MEFFKTINDKNYIESISTGTGQIQISEEEYNTIFNIMMNLDRKSGKGYNLKTDLTWEEFDLSPKNSNEDEEISLEEALNIIRGE